MQPPEFPVCAQWNSGDEYLRSHFPLLISYDIKLFFNIMVAWRLGISRRWSSYTTSNLLICRQEWGAEFTNGSVNKRCNGILGQFPMVLRHCRAQALTQSATLLNPTHSHLRLISWKRLFSANSKKSYEFILNRRIWKNPTLKLVRPIHSNVDLSKKTPTARITLEDFTNPNKNIHKSLSGS